MLVIWTVEAQLCLHERNISQEHGNGKKSAANYEQSKVRNCWCCSTLCRVSELHDSLSTRSVS